jgi:hypothetical protein
MNSGIRSIISSVLIVSFISLPGALSAKGGRGANLIVALKDGPSVAGELIAVKQDSLVLVSPAGKDETVEFDKVSTITIVKKSKAGNGLLIGLLVGGIAGGAWGVSQSKGYEPMFDTLGEGLFTGILLFGTISGLVGLGIGAAAGTDKMIRMEGLSETQKSQVLKRLRGMARMPAAQ